MAWLRNRGMDTSIPDGRTVTPTDDIQILLNCANIWNKSYTTIAALLADSTTLLAVITSNNAIDYLVRSTTWASDVCADSTAMTDIGAWDYAAETLVTDNTWASAIANSTYWSSVLNTSIPTMTSNTTPSGVCSGSTPSSTERDWWNAFDKDFDIGYASSNNSTSSGIYVGYEFPDAFHAYKIYVAVSSNLVASATMTFKIQASNNNSTWTDLTTNQAVSVNNSTVVERYYTTNNTYKYYRVYKVSSSTSLRLTLREFNVFGRGIGGVQNWLRSGGITNKSYTTLAEVLNDTATLTALLSNADAIDYLLSCKGWADTICADSNAMSYIGQNNYVANTLLADSIWASAIANSPYWSSVLNVGIPTMTSDTTPSGVCSSTALVASTSAYYAFDKNTDTKTSSSTYNTSGGLYVRYEFPTAFHAYKVYLAISTSSTATDSFVVKMQGSNDGSTWDDIVSNRTISVKNTPPTEMYYTINANYKYYQVYKVSASAAIRFCINELNVYGREDV